jgi:hypothetical protein
MIDCVVVCGDSFGTGAGLDEDQRFEKSFGGIVSSRLDVPLKVYARSGCCNFTIYLQVKKIIETCKSTKMSPLVLITLTNHSRLFFPIDGARGSRKLDLSNVIYKNYQPYSSTSRPQRPIEFAIDDFPNFTSETISNLGLCLAGSNLRHDKNFSKIVDRKFDAIRMYFEEIYDDGVKLEYDTAITLMMHSMLKENRISHIIMGFGAHQNRFIDQDNFVEIHWGEICSRYPDRHGSGHCDETGHMIAAGMLLEKYQDVNFGR